MAQMGASMLSALAGTETDATFANSAAYVASWLRVLKADSKPACEVLPEFITGTTYNDTEAD